MSDVSTNNTELSAYELNRLNNISGLQQEAQLDGIYHNIEKSTATLIANCSTAETGNVNNRKRTRGPRGLYRSKLGGPKCVAQRPDFIRRSTRIKDNKRQIKDYNEDSDNDISDNKIKKTDKRLYLKFPWFKKKEQQVQDKIYYGRLDDDEFLSDNDDEYKSISKKNCKSSVSTPRLSVSSVTQEMLNNIAYSSVGKQYSSDGTTCHQCRQKTLDQKSYCRFKGCRGIRGMFCGFCLGKRYGEDVADVLLNPKWACPVCRGHCNCSICRRRDGKEPTGQLAPQAVASGYKSVKHFLSKIEEDIPEENCSSDSENYDDDNDKVNNIFEENINETNDVEKLSVNKQPQSNKNYDNCNNELDNTNIINENQDTHEDIIDKLYRAMLLSSTNAFKN